MKRMKVMFGKRRIMILATLAILVLAAAALAASSANFTATSANPGNAFAAGNLAIDNSKGNGASEAAILSASNMKPGDTATGSVTIKNIGSVAGAFSLTKSAVADADGLGGVLLLTIKEGTTTLYSGTLSGYLVTTPANSNTLSLNNWNAGVSHTYDFSVNWPLTHTGSPTDNALMGKSCTFRFQWDAVSL